MRVQIKMRMSHKTKKSMKMKIWIKDLLLRPSEHKEQLDWTTIKQMT